MPVSSKRINSISEIIDDYELILCDLWGVVHDGTSLYPHAANSLRKIRNTGKQLVFISNAPRRAKVAEEVLRKLGISRELYDYIITSGEMGFQAVVIGKWPAASKYYYLGPPKDETILDESKLQRTLDLKEASFVICTGLVNDGDPLESYKPFLMKMLALKLPMICVNPDLIVVKLDGSVINCSGLIAEAYKELGGEVKYFGKPYAEIYEHILEKYGVGIPRSKILAIGDGIETDIKGANLMGIKSVLVTGGILKTESDDDLQRTIGQAAAAPDYIITAFIAGSL